MRYVVIVIAFSGDSAEQDACTVHSIEFRTFPAAQEAEQKLNACHRIELAFIVNDNTE